MKRDTVEAVLSNCVFVPDCPGVREWALVCVRNLCEGCAAAQARIQRLQGAAELVDEEQGRTVVLDRSTGTFSVADQAAPAAE